MRLKAVALAAAAALACASTEPFSTCDIPGPALEYRQQSIDRKVSNYNNNPALYQGFWNDAEEFMCLLTTDPELAYTKNRYVTADCDVGTRGAGARSAAVFSGNAMHHIVRGVCTDRFRSDKAKRACELAMKIMGSATARAAGQAVSYELRLERLLEVCATYLIFSPESVRRTLITTALSLLALCSFAAFNAVYAARFPQPYPTRTTIECGLMIDAKVEITVVAKVR